MYKNNSRDCSNFKGFSPFHFLCDMTGKCHAVGYYSYTHRCVQLLPNSHANSKLIPTI